MRSWMKIILLMLVVGAGYYLYDNYVSEGSLFKSQSTPKIYDEHFLTYGISFPSYFNKGSYATISKATNETSYRKLWDDYQMQGDRPSNNFGTNQVFFLTTNSNEGCPDYIYDVKVIENKIHFFATECKEKKQGYSAYTFAFALSTDVVKNIEEAVVSKNERNKSFKIQEIY